MRLLIVTQACDLNDPVLGFFHSWIVRLSSHFEKTSVMCLKEGEHALPASVSVHSLGKRRSADSSFFEKVRYAVRFFQLTWRLRREYDVVFVHMNPEYVVLGGLLWRLWGKRIVLWRNHRRGGIIVRLGTRLSHVACYTSPESFIARYSHAVQMPIGIDTDLFSRNGSHVSDSILMLGRLDPVKKTDVFIDALEQMHREGIKFFADIYGSPTPSHEEYAESIRRRGAPLVSANVLRFHPGVAHADTARIYASHAIYVNLTPSGSFDKTIGEACASGCIPVIANTALGDILPTRLIVDPSSVRGVADSLMEALHLPGDERRLLSTRLRSYVEREHSLSVLVAALVGVLTGHRV